MMYDSLVRQPNLVRQTTLAAPDPKIRPHLAARALFALFVLTFVANTAWSRLEVTTVSPARQALAVPVDTEIQIDFAEAVDAATVTDQSFVVLGRWTGIVDGALTVEGNVITFTPDSPFSAGDWVTVRLTRQILATSGEPLSGGHAWNFWTASGAATMNFTEIGRLTPGEIPYGAHGGDLDHDGDLDLAVPNEGTDDMTVYLNDGTGVLGPPVFYTTGAVPSPIEAADLNGDRHVDLIVANTQGRSISVFLGNGDGTFQNQQQHDTGVGTRGLAPIDLDHDGWLDLVVANRDTDDISLFRNLGAGTGDFTNELRVDPPSDGETQVNATDLNGDGLEDLIISYINSGTVQAFLGRPSGGFQQMAPADAGGLPWQQAVGDLNGDGLLDVVTANYNNNTAGVLLSIAPGAFAPAVTYSSGAFPIAIDVGDLDGDGDLDMVVSNYLGGTFSIFRNFGDGTFSGRQDLDAQTSGSCAVLHDIDNDGDLDITGIDELADKIILFRNQ